MDKCVVEGCATAVSRAGFKLCRPHWQGQKDGSVVECSRCATLFLQADRDCPRCRKSGPTTGEESPEESGRALSSTKLGEHFSVSAQRMNLVLAELGWIEKYTKGWKPTPQGVALGGETRELRKKGIPYVVWPAEILGNKALLLSTREIGVGTPDGVQAVPSSPGTSPSGSEDAATSLSAEFRARFPATYQAKDGHKVRSRGEAMIDNFLYEQGIVHAYERRVPISEDCYSDFYLPQAKVYIEYWGLEKRAAYAERKAKKQAIYAKYGLHLIELNDDHIAALDDELPKLLLRFGVDCT
jgi:hypothetical protein